MKTHNSLLYTHMIDSLIYYLWFCFPFQWFAPLEKEKKERKKKLLFDLALHSHRMGTLAAGCVRERVTYVDSICNISGYLLLYALILPTVDVLFFFSFQIVAVYVYSVYWKNSVNFYCVAAPNPNVFIDIAFEKNYLKYLICIFFKLLIWFCCFIFFFLSFFLSFFFFFFLNLVIHQCRLCLFSVSAWSICVFDGNHLL